MKDNNHSIFVVLTGVIICYVALGIVISFVLSDAFSFCKDSLLKTGIDTEKKDSAKKTIKLFSCVCLVLYLMFGLIYLFYLKSSDLNDIISIFALSVSIVSYDLAKVIGHNLKKVILIIIK